MNAVLRAIGARIHSIFFGEAYPTGAGIIEALAADNVSQDDQPKRHKQPRSRSRKKKSSPTSGAHRHRRRKASRRSATQKKRRHS